MTGNTPGDPQAVTDKRREANIADNSCKTLVHALVTARLDYANSLLYTAFTDNAAAFSTRAKLRILARLQYDKIRHDSVLQHLHWVPVCVRPTYKVLVFVYSMMQGQAPWTY